MRSPKRGELFADSISNNVVLYRYLAIDKIREEIFFIKVDNFSSPRSSKLPFSWTYDEYKNKLKNGMHTVPDSVKTKDMELKDEKLEYAKKEARDKKIELLGSLIDKHFDVVVMCQNLRSELISARSQSSGVESSRIRALLTRYWWYGCVPNALLDLRSKSGAKPGFNIDFPGNKIGRPSIAKTVYGGNEFDGVNVTTRHTRLFEKAILSYWLEGGMSLAGSYKRLKEQDFIAYNRLEGETVSYPVRERFLPSENQFRRYAKNYIESNCLKNVRRSKEDKARARYLSGNATDICVEVLDVFDFDGTVFNFELVSDDALKQNIGQPTVLFAVDRRSGAVVGWYIWIGTESSRAYRYCIFNAFSSKKDRLKILGIEDIPGIVSGVCDMVFFDRGAGLSESLTETLVLRMGLMRATARPGMGADKGCVERINGIMQENMGFNPGGIPSSESAARDQKKLRAKKFADLTVSEFEVELCKAISEFNLEADARDNLTPDMRRKNVAPNPKEIFEFNQGQRIADAAKSWRDEELYERLLDLKSARISKNGVVYASATYSNDASEFAYNNKKTRGMAGVPILVYEVPDRSSVLIWKMSESETSILEMKPKNINRFGQVPWLEHRRILKYDAAKLAKSRRKKSDSSRKRKVPKLHEDRIRDSLGAPKPIRVSTSKVEMESARQRSQASQLVTESAEMISFMKLKVDASTEAGVLGSGAYRGASSGEDQESFDGYAE